MRHITIVGGGQAGLLLAVGLRQHGHHVRLVQNRSADEIRSGKVLSSQCVFQAARAQERALGSTCGPTARRRSRECASRSRRPTISGAKVISFEGRLSGPAQSVDQRVKYPEFLGVFAANRGTIELRDVGVSDLERYASESDLVVVAAGKADVSKLFARDASRSPFDQPMRALALVNVHGMPPHEGPRCVTATLISGVGELFMIPALTHSGPCDILFFEAIRLARLIVSTDCRTSKRSSRAPRIWYGALFRGKRIALRTSPRRTPMPAWLDGLRRRFVMGLDGCHQALACSALQIQLRSPIPSSVRAPTTPSNRRGSISTPSTAGGPHFSTRPGWLPPPKPAYRRVEASVQWSNMMLLPPPDHAVMLLAKAMSSPALADLIANGFDEPATILPLFADPAQAAAA